jgi:transposase InsO family protein
MACGFVYLAVVLDWATRRVLSWRLSITMEAAFCVETLEDALACHGKPDIFNTDQGSQFTGAAFTGVLADNGIVISMDGKGAWRDNVFVERLWRSVKYEEIYEPTKPSAKHEVRLAGISTSTTANVHIRALTAAPRIKPTSTRCHSAWQPNHGRDPLIDAEILFRQTGPALMPADGHTLRNQGAASTRLQGAGTGVQLFRELRSVRRFRPVFGAVKQNLKIIETPIHYKARTFGETQISRFRDGWLLLKMAWFAYQKLKAI